jgi:hypothetical protein
MESVRSAVTTVLLGKKVFLLTGTKRAAWAEKNFEVEAPDKLMETARRNPDACAFGFIQGSWVAAA